MNIALSELDEMRFGCRTAKALHVSTETLPDALAFCRQQRVQLLVARCSAADVHTAQAMERAGCLLMDTLVYSARDLTRTPIPQDTGRVSVHHLAPGEEDAVVTAAAEAFHGYAISHYHADPRLAPADCDAVYASWARALCSARGNDSDVLVASANGAVLGFGAVQLNMSPDGDGILYGVVPSAREMGIYTSLVIQSLRWCCEKGTARMLMSTQITNTRVQRVCAKLGFVPDSAYYTFHKWFDER